MAIKVECGSCFASFRVGDDKAGKTLRCKECGEQIRVPSEDGDDSRKGDASGRQRRSGRGRQAPKKQSANPALLVGLAAGGVLVVALGGFFLFRGKPDAGPTPNDAANPAVAAANVASGSTPAAATEATTPAGGQAANATTTAAPDTQASVTSPAPANNVATTTTVTASTPSATPANPNVTATATNAASSTANGLPAANTSVGARWNAKADPPTASIDWPNPIKTTIRLPEQSDAQLVFPQTSSPFVAVGFGNSRAGDTEVWNLVSGKKTGLIEGNWNGRTDPKVSPDGKLVACKVVALNVAPKIEIWSFETGQLVKTLQVDELPIFAPYFDFADDSRLVVYTFGASGGQATPGQAVITPAIIGGAAAPRAEFVKRIRVWDVASGAATLNVAIDSSSINDKGFALSPTGKYLCVSDGDNVVFVFDLQSAEPVAKIKLPRRAAVSMFTLKELAYSPDGSAIAALLDAGQESLIVVTDAATGEQTELPFPGSLAGVSSYRGPKLEWLADGSGWLIEGEKLVDRASGRLVWEFERAAGAQASISRHVVPNGLLHASVKGRARELKFAPFPTAKIRASLEAMAQSTDAILRPGQEISLKFAVGKSQQAATDDETTKKIGEAIAKRLAADKITLAEGQPLALEISYSEAAGRKLEERTGGSILNPGTATGRSVQATQVALKLSLKDGKREVWNHEISIDPRFLIVRGDSSTEKARESSVNMLTHRLASLPLPYFIPKDKNLSSLPGRSQLD